MQLTILLHCSFHITKLAHIATKWLGSKDWLRHAQGSLWLIPFKWQIPMLLAAFQSFLEPYPPGMTQQQLRKWSWQRSHLPSIKHILPDTWETQKGWPRPDQIWGPILWAIKAVQCYGVTVFYPPAGRFD